MNKLTFTLKQHTPIIHFQHDYAGATLRATELKPKLDKFIIANWELENREKQGTIRKVHPEWFISKDHNALNYKVRIKAEGEQELFCPRSYVSSKGRNRHEQNARQHVDPRIKLLAPSPYFANEDKISKRKWSEVKVAVLQFGEIVVEFRCFDSELKREIEQIFAQFMVVTNFGTRQSKGFGSFTVDGNDRSSNVNILKRHFKKVLKVRGRQHTIVNLFKTISRIYSDIKCNQGSSYLKDFIEKNEVYWERTIVKEVLLNGCDKSEEIDDQYQYSRAVLGLAQLLDYPQIDKKIIISANNSDIQRYRSPIMFKVIDNTIYLVGSSVNPEILGERFTFSESKNKLSLDTPSDFDLELFLEYVAERDNNLQIL